MTFVVAHRFSGVKKLTNRLRAFRVPTRQERANLYVSRMPIAVVTASLGGHPSDSGGRHR
ncbi:hypothetical protein [Mycobacterium sp.]|uniref:hypothetical protein n=1 Tax=Mycobacterium sp. TaxID=1785 RepID=UPI0025EAA748|nr:hypothetical protein [Mycobacterium sp.]